MASQAAIKAAWEPACVGPWSKVRLYGGAVIYVDPLMVEAVMVLNVIAELYNYPCSGPDNGAFNCRNVKGTKKRSKHAYGIAIDRRWKTNPQGKPLRTDRPAAMNRAIVSVRTNNGAQVWIWGGYWNTPDAMHDEAGCTPQDLATGINWATVARKAGTPPPYIPTPKPPTYIPPADEEDEVLQLIRSDPDQDGNGAVIAVDGIWRHEVAGGPDYEFWLFRCRNVQQNVDVAAFNKWINGTHDAQNVNLAAFYAKAIAEKM